jgi:hypothetical protein
VHREVSSPEGMLVVSAYNVNFTSGVSNLDSCLTTRACCNKKESINDT